MFSSRRSGGPRRVRFASRVSVGFGRDGNVGAYAELHVRYGNDPRTPFGGGSENSVVRPKVSARSGHQRGEFGNKVASLKDDLGGPVAPPALQTIEKPAVRQFRQAFGRDGRPRNGNGPIVRSSTHNASPSSGISASCDRD